MANTCVCARCAIAPDPNAGRRLRRTTPPLPGHTALKLGHSETTKSADCLGITGDTSTRQPGTWTTMTGRGLAWRN